MEKIYQIYGRDAHDMTLRLLTAANAIARVPAGGSVALKPNLVVTGRPEDGAVTHPGVVSGCVEYFRAHGVRDISVIESSWVGDRTLSALRASGLADVCDKWDVPFYDLKKDDVRPVDTPVGKIDVCRRALDAGLLVDLPGQEAAILSYIDPLVAVAISLTVLGEPVTALQLVGGAMILAFTLANEV